MSLSPRFAELQPGSPILDCLTTRELSCSQAATAASCILQQPDSCRRLHRERGKLSPFPMITAEGCRWDYSFLHCLFNRHRSEGLCVWPHGGWEPAVGVTAGLASTPPVPLFWNALLFHPDWLHIRRMLLLRCPWPMLPGATPALMIRVYPWYWRCF